MGFTRKDIAKKILEKHFIADIDYKILLRQLAEQHGGLNKEHIMLNIKTFKKMCMKANTKKADEIHDYFIKLENILHEVMNEESNELRKQLQTKELQLIEQAQTSELEKEILLENTLLSQFPVNC